MINSRSTPKEIIREYNRLKIALASLMDEYTSFAVCLNTNRSLSELDEEFETTHRYFKEVEKRYKVLANN